MTVDPGTTPLVSIGLPVYNAADTLPRALDSLLAQDYGNVEIILSDNCSDDGTADLCREYAGRDPRIRFSANETNVGVINNLKKVLREARGNLFMWAAADDFWHPDFVSKLQARLADDPGAGVVMCAVDRVRPDGSLLDGIRFPRDLNPDGKSHLGMSLAMISNTKYNLFFYGLFRRELLRRAFASTRGNTSADRWFLCHFALGARFLYVDEVLHVRTNHQVHYSKRYPDDPQSVRMKEQGGKLIDLSPLADVASGVIRAVNIPLRRKLCLPLILAKLFLFKLRWDLYPKILNLVRPAWTTLRGVKNERSL